MKAVALASTLAVIATVATATIGGDISQEFSTSTFECCRREGWDFMITRAYRSNGEVEPVAGPNIRNSKAAGIPYTDIYHFPCSYGVSAAAQVAADINAVGRIFGMLWFDIETNEDSRCAWRADKNENCQFLGELISAGHANGVKMGIYASVYMWESIMGSCTVGSSLALWYAHYDGRQTFSDFSPFGGWSRPAMKQYGDAVGYCGINSDADWYA